MRHAHLPMRRLCSVVEYPTGGMAQLMRQCGLKALQPVHNLCGQLYPRYVPAMTHDCRKGTAIQIVKQCC